MSFSTAANNDRIPLANMELVSIIIPAYNAEKYLRDTIDSAIAQTYKNYEIIVVDDGSTDRTQNILAEYGDKIRVVRQSNKGTAAACNAGVATARGTWVCFLDADDIWLSDKLALQVERCNGSVISHTDSVCFGDGMVGEIRRSSFEPPYSGQVLKELLVVNFITKSTVMMRRNVFNHYGGFDEGYVTCEDWQFWIKVCAEHELGYLPEPVVRYRVHLKSKSMISRRTLTARLRIINAAFGPGGVAQSLSQLRSKSLASAFQVTCHYACESGDWKFALNCALHALRYDPFVAHSWKKLIKASLIPLGVKY
jgi:glycosyltransferase involved in cell wall biosynthesis